MRAVQKASAWVALFLVTLLAIPGLAAAADYTGTFTGTFHVLRNANGTTVFMKPIGEGTPQRLTPIGVRGFLYVLPPGNTIAPMAISDSDIVVGSSRNLEGPLRAVILENDKIINIHWAVASAFGLDSASTSSAATGVNNAGEVIGTITSASGSFAFHYQDGVVTDLGSVAGMPINSASDINNLGQILVSGPGLQSGIYSQGTVQRLSYSRTEEPSLPSITSYAINDAGQVTGTLTYTNGGPPDVHAFVYSGGAVKDIGSIGTTQLAHPRDINNAGVVVGAMDAPGGTSRAFVYRDGHIIDLTNVSQINLAQPITDAISIGDDGSIFVRMSGAITLTLNPSTLSAIDPAIFNFEASTQGWENNGEPIVTLATSAAQKFAGEKSLGIQFNENGFASVRYLSPTVKPGDTITFRIYLPADSKIEWVQPYALGGASDEWAWHGNWTSVSNLQLGAWNTLTVSIPAEAHPLHSIGLEMFASEPSPGIVYLDSIDYGSTPDVAQYSFETGKQNWQRNGDPIVYVATTAAQQFAGRKSLVLEVNGIGLARVSVENPGVQPGATVTFRVFIPEGTTLDSVQPFVQEGAAGGWAWHGSWRSIAGLQAGAWNSISVNVPAEAHEIGAIGIELATTDANPGLGNHGIVFVDSVSF